MQEPGIGSRGIGRPCGLVLAVAVVMTQPAAASLVLDEILYDPDGPDSGREWVEIRNTGPWPAPADGLVLEFANGAEPEHWSVVWRGGDGEWIEPADVFVVGERDDGPVDSEARLGLQNGPDALRLVRDGFVLDLVGWGEPLDPRLREGEPAAAAKSGESLTRTDGIDTDDNESDFVSRRPSPGRANVPRVDFAVSLRPERGRALPIDQTQPRSRVRVVVENRGRERAALRDVACTLAGNRVVFPADTLAPGAEVCALTEGLAEIVGDEGVFASHVFFPGDEDTSNDRDSLVVALSPSVVRINEIHPRPVAPQTEWIELDATAPVRLAGWSVEDASGGAVRMLPADSVIAGLLVLSAVGGAGTIGSEGWPSLNDRAAPSGVADTLFLIDPVGRIRDWAVYGEAAPGISWIRLDGPPLADPRDLWTSDPDHPGGTPGRETGEVGESIWPLSGGVSMAEFPAGAWIDLPAGTRAYTLEVYDLRGRRVSRTSGAVRGERIRWDARDRSGKSLIGGLYLLDVLAQTDAGVRQERRTVVLDR